MSAFRPDRHRSESAGVGSGPVVGNFPTGGCRLSTRRGGRWKWFEARGAILLAAILGNTVLGAILIVAAVLRETPDFWTYDGGYPELLRWGVQYGFLPLWLAVGLLSVGIAGRGWASVRRGYAAGAFGLLAGGFHVSQLAIATTIAIWNNVSNIITGMPFHSH